MISTGIALCGCAQQVIDSGRAGLRMLGVRDSGASTASTFGCEWRRNDERR